MSVNCQQATEQVGNGVAAALRGVDCIAGEASAAAFGRLFAPGGSLGTVLTLVLTLFIALFAFALLTGRTNIGVRSLVPRMMTLGLVLTFATSWIAYQSVVWNLAVATPDYLAGILTGAKGSATDTFAQKIDVVFIAIQEASGANEEFSAFSPEGMMWLGAMLFMLGTVGLLVTTRIALALLMALLWGGNTVAIKAGLVGLPPAAMAVLRFIIGALTVWVGALFVGIPVRVPRAVWGASGARLSLPLQVTFSDERLDLGFLQAGHQCLTLVMQAVLFFVQRNNTLRHGLPFLRIAQQFRQAAPFIVQFDFEVFHLLAQRTDLLPRRIEAGLHFLPRDQYIVVGHVIQRNTLNHRFDGAFFGLALGFVGFEAECQQTARNQGNTFKALTFRAGQLAC